MFLSLPGDDLDPGDLGALSEIYHPGRSVDIEVIQYGTAVHADRDVSVNSSRCVSSDPLTANMSLILTLVVYPRTLLKRQVLH